MASLIELVFLQQNYKLLLWHPSNRPTAPLLISFLTNYCLQNNGFLKCIVQFLAVTILCWQANSGCPLLRMACDRPTPCLPFSSHPGEHIIPTIQYFQYIILTILFPAQVSWPKSRDCIGQHHPEMFIHSITDTARHNTIIKQCVPNTQNFARFRCFSVTIFCLPPVLLFHWCGLEWDPLM